MKAHVDRKWFDMMDEAQSLCDQAEQIENDLLRRNGWTLACNLPGASWLWQKEINGVLVAVQRQSALTIESFYKEPADDQIIDA